MFFADDAVLGGFQGNHFIVIDPAAPPSVTYAAQQLQEYLRRIGGKVLRIVATDQDEEPHHLLPLAPCIYVGPSRLLTRRLPAVSEVALEPEELFIWKSGKTLVLTGGGSRGVLYAVFGFLERYLGVRFLTAGVETVPDRLAPLPAAINDRSKPAFEYRDMVHLWRASGDWAVKNRMNGHFANVTDLQGGRVAFYPIVHSLEHLMPSSRYFEAHPEYYSLIAGERTPRQLCLSNPEVREICSKEVLRWIEQNPTFDIIDVSDNDGGGVCDCESCREMNAGEASSAGLIMRFVNTIAEQVGRRHPGKWIGALSYATNRYPPKNVPIAENVLIRLCGDGEIRKRLDAWRSVTPNIYIWAYFVFTHYPVLDGIAAAARFYRDAGVKGLFYETRASTGFGGVEDMRLRLYVAGKMLWDPDDDPRRHIEDYVNGYYGPGAAEMLAVLDCAYALKKKMKMDWKVDDGWWDGNYELGPFLTELEAETRPLFTAARRKSRGTVYASRVEEASVPSQYNALFGRPRPPRFGKDRAFPRDVRGQGRAIERFLELTRSLRIVHPGLETAVTPVPLVRLRRDLTEVLILPAPGGRIVQVLFGEQRIPLIRLPNDLENFTTIGYEEYVGRFFHDPGWAETFAVEERRRGFVRLRAVVDDRWVVSREYRLNAGNELRVATTVTNAGDSVREARVRPHCRWQFDGGRDTVSYRTVDGREQAVGIAECRAGLKSHMFQNDTGDAAQYAAGADMPDGCWTFRLASQGVSIEHHFPAADTEKVLLVGGGADSALFTEDLVAEGHRLEPGASMTFRHRFRFVALNAQSRRSPRSNGGMQ